MLLLAPRAFAADTTPSSSASADARAAMGREAVRALAAGLDDADPDVREAAAEAFGDIGNPAAAKVLRRLLKDDNPAVRVEAGYALYRLGLPDGVPAIEAVVLAGTKGGSRLSAAQQLRLLARNESRVRGIRRLAAVGGEAVVRVFEKTIKDPSGAVRDATAVALARLGFDEFGRQFVDALKDSDESVRAAAARALGQIGQPYGLEALQAASRDPSVTVREEAMRALARYDAQDSARLLAQGAKDADARVRSRALAGLAKLSDSESSPLLRAVLKADPAMEAQLACQAGLARRGDRVDLQEAQAALERKDFDLRLLALDVLAAVDTGPSTALLARTVLHDPDGRVRVRAAAILVRRLARRGAAR